MNQADAQRVLTETIDYNSLICVGLAASLAPSALLCPIRCPLFCCSARHLFALRVLTCLPPPLSSSSPPPLSARSPFIASNYHGYMPPHPDTPAVTYALVEAAPPAAKLEAEAKAAKIAAVAKAHPELRLGPTGQTFNEAWQARHRKGLPMSRQSTHPR